MHLYGCYVYVFLKVRRDSTGSSGVGVTGSSCKSPDLGVGKTLSLLKEQQDFLTTS